MAELRIAVHALCAVPVRDGEGPSAPLIHIPEGATLRVDGNGLGSGLIEIEWRRRRYAVFESDLRDRTSVR